MIGGLAIETFCAHLDAVNTDGGLNPYYPNCIPFIALVNTCTGQATGSASGCVHNWSNHNQLYIDSFGEISCIKVCSSLYFVAADGKALLLATGYVDCNTPPP
ncbi:MAG: hypothetical protein ACM3U2_16315 [Deltaproteobacteria bacterium]